MSTKVFLLAAFFFSHIFTGVHLSKPCPKQCSCHSSWLRGVSSVVVDCSKRGLTSIPTKGVSRYVTSLVLNDNLITEIPRNAFKRYRYLREIYLYKNFIASIHPQAFRGLRRLKELSLHSNQLSVIENGTFAGLRRLDRLYLFTNLLQGINNGVFQGLTNLKTLYLHENLLRSIPPQSFKELKKLNLLTLHRNHIQVLHTGSMEGLHSVTSIFLHQNKIRKVENNAFAGCKNVVKLQLGINQLSNITKEMFIGLESLKELYLDKNQIGLIENPDVFTHVSHLTKLVLLGNRLTDLLPNTFERLYNLRILSISGNQLRELRPGMFVGLPLLHTLLLQENKIQWIEPYAFQGLTALQRLYLFRNEIFYVQERTFFGLFALVELNLGVNKIEGLAKDAFLGLPRLVSLQLNSNFINTIRFGTFAKLRSLYRLVLYFNKITRVEKGAFDDCKRLGSLLWYPPLTLVKSSRTLKKIPSNDFKCDCQAVWLKQWLTQKTSKVGSIFCNGPAALKGRNVTEVDDEHFICAPIFMATEPKLTLLKSGKTAQIRCNVNALAEYTWIKNGSVLTNQFKTFQTNTGALFVHNVTEADSGEYICLVKTENATLAGSSIVKVGAQPSIIGNKEEIVDVQKENENVVLICPNEGFPKPLVFWHYAGKLIQDGSEERFIGFDGRLILTKMTAKNAGVYVCTANNEFGMDKKSFYLRVSAEKESYCQPTCGTGYECKMKYTCQCSKERALNDGMCSSTVEGRSFGSGDGPENNEIGDNEANDVEDDLDNDEFSRESFTDVSHSIMTTTSSTTPKRGGPVV